MSHSMKNYGDETNDKGNTGDMIALLDSLSSGKLNESQQGLTELTSFLSVFLTNLISIPFIFLLELN